MFTACVLLALLVPRPFLILKDYNSGVTLAVFPLSPGTRVSVEWVHSVDLTPWRETYQPMWPRGIRLIETTFRNYGPGVPVNPGGHTAVENGWFVVRGLSEERENVLYLISNPNYKLIIDDLTIPLSRLVPLPTSLHLSAAWYSWWWNEKMARGAETLRGLMAGE